MWRRQRHLGDGASHASCSSDAGCSYHKIGDVFVCAGSGRLHVCGDACRQERVIQGECTVLCAVTGEPVGQSFFVGEEAADAEQCDEDGEAAGGHDLWTAGALGRAFQIGYDCENEEEMHAAIYGNKWV